MPITTYGDLLAAPGRSLPVPPASDRDAWSAANLHPPTLRALRDRATADLAAPWPVPLARGFARYFRDGDRDGYEQIVFARQRRLSRAAVMAATEVDPLDFDPLWIDEVADGVTLLCEQSTWCWPAHDDTFRRHGAVVPTVTEPFLDLGAGEVAAQLAYIDHLLAEQLDAHVPGLRARIRYEVDRRVLTPFVERRDWHWLGLDGDLHNWCAWIHGNVLVAGLSLMDDGPPRAHLVDLAVDGLLRYLGSIPPDGAIDEGYSYWWNGAGRALEALDVLRHATGSTPPLDPAILASLRETVAFPHRMHLGGGWYVNHADGPARPTTDQPWHVLHRAARQFGDVAAQSHAAAHREPDSPVANEDQGLGRLLRALTDPDWIAAAPSASMGPSASPLPRDVWLPSVQVLVARPAAGTTAGLSLVVKGGHNNEHHNHNDVGSLIAALNGVPVLVDAGRPTYTAQTFGPDRYAIWTMQSAWHNVPEILDTAQAAGAGHAARDVTVHIGQNESWLTLDLAPAYPHPDIRQWRRTARLDRRDGRIRVTDSWSVRSGPPESGSPRTRLHLLIAGEVRTVPGRADITALDGAGLATLTWEPADAPASITERTLDDPMLSDVWGERLTRIHIDVSELGPIGTITWTLEETQ